MARIRIVYSKGEKVAEYHDGILVWSAAPLEERTEAGFYVLGDIAPYKSMVDGSMIEGRRQHRDHLRRNNLLEVGNETKHLKPYGNYGSPAGLKEELIRNVNRVKDAQRR